MNKDFKCTVAGMEFMSQLYKRLPQMQRGLKDNETWPELEPATPNCTFITASIRYDVADLAMAIRDYSDKYIQPAVDDMVAQLHAKGRVFKFYTLEMPAAAYTGHNQEFKGATVRVLETQDDATDRQGLRFDMAFTVIS